jgi:hypothetical protein
MEEKSSNLTDRCNCVDASSFTSLLLDQYKTCRRN